MNNLYEFNQAISVDYLLMYRNEKAYNAVQSGDTSRQVAWYYKSDSAINTYVDHQVGYFALIHSCKCNIDELDTYNLKGVGTYFCQID